MRYGIMHMNDKDWDDVEAEEKADMCIEKLRSENAALKRAYAKAYREQHRG
jgi:hypothetical protein